MTLAMSAGMPTPTLMTSPFFTSAAQRRQMIFRSSNFMRSMESMGFLIWPEKAGS